MLDVRFTASKDDYRSMFRGLDFFFSPKKLFFFPHLDTCTVTK